MLNVFSRLFFTTGKKSISNELSSEKVLRQSIDELEKFTKEELPALNKSTENALLDLEQKAKNIKALINIK